MSRVRSRDTKPEIAVRSALHRMGYRFRLHNDTLPGTPDLVFSRRKRVIFVHGCFWHHHDCRHGQARSKTNTEFWDRKIEANRLRDASAVIALLHLGWKAFVVWECEIRRSTWQEAARRFLDDV
jgi:DNA mismatch endonuclease (patch repair protein)